MPTVRCPSCRRALNLPEAAVADSARCPLCGAVFAVGDVEEKRPRPPRPASAPVPVGAKEVPAGGSDDFDFDRDAPHFDGGNRHGLDTASGWLKVMVTLGVFHVMTCGMCACLEAQDRVSSGPSRKQAAWLYGGLMAVRLVALGVIYAGAERLRRRRALSLARTGAIFALLYAVLSPLPSAPLLIDLMESLGRPRGRALSVPTRVWLSLALMAGTSLCGLVGSILALRLLSRPEVERAFRG